MPARYCARTWRQEYSVSQCAMEKLQCSDNLAIPQPGGSCLTPTDYIGAGANGFVLKVSDESTNISALKIVPVIVRPDEKKTGRINREKQFYQYLANAEKMPHLASATACWSIESLERTAYLKWNKTIRTRLSVKALDHPSQIVKNTYEEFELCVHFVQMEYYACGNLKTWLKCNSNKCEETYALRIQFFRDILSAVDFLHTRDLMHRDICPSNIFLARNNDQLHAVLGDFDSIVSCGEQALWPLTKRREAFTRVMGTDPYSAPEIPGGNYDKRCDLYSLGVIALNLFFNILDVNELLEAIYQIRENDVAPTCILMDDTNLLLNIVKEQLSSRPERRISSSHLLDMLKWSMSRKEIEREGSRRKESLYLLEFYTNVFNKLYDLRSALVQLSPMPEPKRGGFSVATCAGKSYVIGGYSSKMVQEYDTQTGWQDRPLMLERRHRCGAAALGGRLFAVGGYDGNTSLNTAEEYDLETGRWTHVAPMTVPRWGVGVATLNNLLFAIGGGDVSLRLNSAESYDPRAGRWTKAAPMHEPRQFFGCAGLGDQLYVAGGRTGKEWTASVEWFDLRAGRWTHMRDMDVPRSNFVLVELKGQLLAAGGDTNGGNSLNTVEVYDKKRDAWSTLDVRLPRGGHLAGFVLAE